MPNFDHRNTAPSTFTPAIRMPPGNSAGEDPMGLQFWPAIDASLLQEGRGAVPDVPLALCPSRGATGSPTRRGRPAPLRTMWPRPSWAPSPACAARAWRRRSRRPGRNRWCCGRRCWAAPPAASRRRWPRCAGCSVRSRMRCGATTTSGAAVMRRAPSRRGSGSSAGVKNAFTPPRRALFRRPCRRAWTTGPSCRRASWSTRPRSRRWARPSPPTRAAWSCGATRRRPG